MQIMKNHPNPEEVRMEAKRRKEADRKRSRGEFDLFTFPTRDDDSDMDVVRGYRAAGTKRPRTDGDPLPGMGRDDDDYDDRVVFDQRSFDTRGHGSSTTAGKGSGDAVVSSSPEKRIGAVMNVEDAAEAYVCSRLRPDVAVGIVMDAMVVTPS
jgi:hypothetical protein